MDNLLTVHVEGGGPAGGGLGGRGEERSGTKPSNSFHLIGVTSCHGYHGQREQAARCVAGNYRRPGRPGRPGNSMRRGMKYVRSLISPAIVSRAFVLRPPPPRAVTPGSRRTTARGVCWTSHSSSSLLSCRQASMAGLGYRCQV